MTAVLIVSVMAVATTAGAVLLARWGRAASINPVIAPGFAAGIMIWLALGEVAPESVEDIGRGATVAAMAAGAALVALASGIVARSPLSAGGFGAAPVIGVALALHDVPEGFAVAAVLSGAGVVVALPMIAAVAGHNLAEKLAFVGAGGADDPGAGAMPRWVVLAVATLPEPLGALVATAGAGVAPGVVDAAAPLAGGMMLAVALGSLPSIAREVRRVRSFTAAGVGGAMSIAMLGVVLPG
ncbi:MAG: hypothetical protein GX868_08385 [Actinobacteria bacterium]|nr:hypothetical protein [Actinomycetota bacterium]